MATATATATRWQQWRGAEGADEARKSGCFSCCYLVSVCTAPGLGACLPCLRAALGCPVEQLTGLACKGGPGVSLALAGDPGTDLVMKQHPDDVPSLERQPSIHWVWTLPKKGQGRWIYLM
jgi:hypothetical protein